MSRICMGAERNEIRQRDANNTGMCKLLRRVARRTDRKGTQLISRLLSYAARAAAACEPRRAIKPAPFFHWNV